MFGGNVLKQIITCNMQVPYSLFILSLPVWDAEEDKIRQPFILSRQQVSPVQGDFRGSEAPQGTPDPESLFGCPLAQKYQWVYQG